MKVIQPLPRSAYVRNADIYKILANAIRLEILNLLREQEMSVEELVQVVKVTKANMSQHLALLRHAKLVSVRPEGVQRYYRITDPRIIEPCRILHKMKA